MDPSVSERPFVIRGIESVLPPVPVEAATPAPVRMNQSSSVNCVAPSGEGEPDVPRRIPSFTPSSSRAWFPEGGVPSSAGAPDTHVGPPVVVPLMPPTEPATEAPAPSFTPQRPMRPVPEVSSEFIDPWICAWVLATFQIRTSSTRPAKKPASAPVESDAVPIAGAWIESERGVWVVAVQVPLSTPSRYRQNCEPLYVAAAWCQTFCDTAPAPLTGLLLLVARWSSKSASISPLEASIPRK